MITLTIKYNGFFQDLQFLDSVPDSYLAEVIKYSQKELIKSANLEEYASSVSSEDYGYINEDQDALIKAFEENNE